MKRNSVLFSLLATVMLLTSACKKEDEPLAPADALVGKWVIESTFFLGQIIPGDGSYLVFKACSGTTCTGEDYLASDSTSGTFTYDLSADASTMTIVDLTDDGGNYDGLFNVTELTETDFKINGDTPFGVINLEMVKE